MVVEWADPAAHQLLTQKKGTHEPDRPGGVSERRRMSKSENH